ncbi:unnamed protein product, partial [Staurois parvus]
VWDGGRRVGVAAPGGGGGAVHGVYGGVSLPLYPPLRTHVLPAVHREMVARERAVFVPRLQHRLPRPPPTQQEHRPGQPVGGATRPGPRRPPRLPPSAQAQPPPNSACPVWRPCAENTSYCTSPTPPHGDTCWSLCALQPGRAEDTPEDCRTFCLPHSAPFCPDCELQHRHCDTAPLLELYRNNRERLEKRIGDLEEIIGSKEEMIGSRKDGYREIQILICGMKDSLTQDFREMRDYLEKQERASFWRMQQEQESAQKATSQEVQTLLAEIDRMRKEKVELQERIENDWIAVLKHSGSGEDSVSSSSPKKQYTLDENRLVDTTDAISRIKQSLLCHPLLEEVSCPPKQVFEETLVLQTSPGAADQTPRTGLPERSPNNLLQWATHISFDLQTVNSHLAVSEDLKTVKVTKKSVPYEKSSRRFTNSQAQCSQAFSTECAPTGSSVCRPAMAGGWGAAAAEMGKDGKLGRNNLSWCVEWNKDHLCAWHNDQDIHVFLSRPQTVGVLLDCPQKELKFYSISADSQILIHCYKVQIQSHIFPAAWLYGLKAGNSLTIRDLQSTSM